MSTSPIIISVIVPVYNTEQYLPECLDSIINQSYKNLEIICIDDGSTDNSRHILDSYAVKDKRIKIIHQENKGVSAARNAGLDIATGGYISFVDSDDWLKPDCYERLLQYNEKQQYDVIEGSVIIENKKSKNATVGIKNNFADILDSLNKCYTCSKIWNKEFLDKHKLKFSVDISYCEDVLFTIKAAYYARSWNFTDIKGYFYRQNPLSISHISQGEQLRKSDKVMVIRQALLFADKNNFSSEDRIYLENFLIRQAVSNTDLEDDKTYKTLTALFVDNRMLHKRYRKIVRKKIFSFSIKNRELFLFGAHVSFGK